MLFEHITTYLDTTSFISAFDHVVFSSELKQYMAFVMTYDAFKLSYVYRRTKQEPLLKKFLKKALAFEIILLAKLVQTPNRLIEHELVKRNIPQTLFNYCEVVADSEVFMKTRQYLIKRASPIWRQIDDLCFRTKQLYNKANYVIRQTFFETSKLKDKGVRKHAVWLRSYDIWALARYENWPEYRALPAMASVGVVRMLDQAWKSFFAAVRAYKRDPSKFKAPPRPPKYKDKRKGRYPLVIYKGSGHFKIKGGYLHFIPKYELDPIKIGKNITNIKQVRFIPTSGVIYWN